LLKPEQAYAAGKSIDVDGTWTFAASREHARKQGRRRAHSCSCMGWITVKKRVDEGKLSAAISCRRNERHFFLSMLRGRRKKGKKKNKRSMELKEINGGSE
jgi:hypothetical protein